MSKWPCVIYLKQIAFTSINDGPIMIIIILSSWNNEFTILVIEPFIKLDIT